MQTTFLTILYSIQTTIFNELQRSLPNTRQKHVIIWFQTSLSQNFHILSDKHPQPICSSHPRQLIDFVDFLVHYMAGRVSFLFSDFGTCEDGLDTLLTR